MPSQDQLIRQFRSRLTFLYTVKSFLLLATLWAFVWGSTVLALRVAVGSPREPLLWGLAAVPLLILLALWMARRQLPAPSVVRALLDQQNHCGGILMATEERSPGEWTKKTAIHQSPRVRWQGGRSWGLFATASAFVLVCFLLPQQYMRLGAEPPLEIEREVERLNKQIEVLKEEKILERERAEALQHRLEQLEEEASGRDPVKTLDAIDHLDKLAQDAAKKAAENAIQKSEQTGQAEALAEALKKHAESLAKKGKQPDRLAKKNKDNGMNAKTLTRAMEELARLTRQALKDSDLQKQLEQQLQDHLNGMRPEALDPEMLNKLAEALGQSKAELIEQMKKLVKVRLIDGKMLKECEGGGKCDSDELLAILNKNGKASVKKMLKMASGIPGLGGINRGRADAPLIFGEKSPEDQKKFKEAILPPTRLAELKKSRVLGSTKVQPKVGNEGEIADSGALSGSQSGGGSAVKQTILPRHRRTVDRYFDRPGRKNE